ncbi:hypothetical protein [Amycolatopsis sp. GM8]|uniref:hypothetical protein n=1 Tax=Amycolatopsis sp. GM8 TaxID=2896530 RepID=UPI001F1D9682|nr:hypothetical protein [Amycolatopsis sp. GM8]
MLWLIGVEIDQKTTDLIELRRKRPQLDRDRRLAYARAFLSNEGTVESRKLKAELAADEAKFALETHDQEIAVCLDALKALRDRSEIGRSINSNLKEELRQLSA